MRRDDVTRAGVLILAVAFGTAVVAAEPKTAADFTREAHAWLRGKLHDDFEAHGRRDAPWAAAYREFLDGWTHAALDGYPPATMERLEARAAKLAVAGCDDPVFALFRGRIELSQGRPKPALEAFRQLAAVQRAGYPALYARYALLWSREAKAAIEPAAAVVPDPDVALHETVLAIARDPSFASGRQWIYVVGFMPGDDAFIAAAAERFAKPDSGVDPWITAMVVGRDHVRRAWEARGTDFAGGVTPEGWKGFGEHLALAREQFTRAHEMHPEWPDAASEMIQVSLGEGSDEERLWFDRAVAAQLDHATSYRRMLRQTLLPRWGGSHEAMFDFGRECLATGRFDTIVPSYGYEAAVAVGEELPDIRDAFALPGVYDDCVKVCRGYIDVATNPDALRTWQSRLAVAQWATGRYAEACATLDDLRDDLMQQPLQEFRARGADVVGESRLFGGPHADAFAAAESLVERGKVPEALAAYKPLAKQDSLPAAAQRIVTGRITTLENAVALDRYEWVDLQPRAGLAGWRVVRGDWQVEPDGTLVGTSGERGRLKLLCETELGQDVELTAECDLVQRPTPGKPWGRITFQLAHAANEDQLHRALCVRLYGPQRVIQISHGAIGGQGPAARAATKAKNNVRIVLWDGKISVFVNGKKALDKLELAAEWLEGGGLGIAEYADQGPPTQVRIRKLRARKLDKAPDDF